MDIYESECIYQAKINSAKHEIFSKSKEAILSVEKCFYSISNLCESIERQGAFLDNEGIVKELIDEMRIFNQKYADNAYELIKNIIDSQTTD